MTPSLLREIGEALYGPQWHRALAASLSVNERTIQRWLSGQNPIPALALSNLYALLAARIGALHKLAMRVTVRVPPANRVHPPL